MIRAFCDSKGNSDVDDRIYLRMFTRRIPEHIKSKDVLVELKNILNKQTDLGYFMSIDSEVMKQYHKKLNSLLTSYEKRNAKYEKKEMLLKKEYKDVKLPKRERSNCEHSASGNRAVPDFTAKAGLTVVFRLLKDNWKKLRSEIRNNPLRLDMLHMVLKALKELPPLSLANELHTSRVVELDEVTTILRDILISGEIDVTIRSLAAEILLYMAIQRGSLTALLLWINTILGCQDNLTVTCNSFSYVQRVLNVTPGLKFLEGTIQAKEVAHRTMNHLVFGLTKLCNGNKDNNIGKRESKEGSNVVYVWGNNSSHQLLLKNSSQRELLPVSVNCLKNIRTIEGGQQCTFITYVDGTVCACGKGCYNCLGLGDQPNHIFPMQIHLGAFIVQISCSKGSDGHTLCLSSEGRVFSWNYGDYGKLGHGEFKMRWEPQVVKGELSGEFVVQISAGLGHSAAVTSNGSLYTWGEGIHGQLGHNDTISRSEPVMVKEISKVSQVSCGASYTLALSADSKTIWSFGNIEDGQLGHPALSTVVCKPMTIRLLRGIGMRKICASHSISMALGLNGRVYTWGKGPCLGHGELIHITMTPRLVTGLADINVIDVSVGESHCLSLTDKQEVFAWGNNSLGQCGQGHTRSPLYVPYRVSSVSNIKPQQISAGSSHSFAWLTPCEDRGEKERELHTFLRLDDTTYGEAKRLLKEYSDKDKITCFTHIRQQEDFMIALVNLLKIHLIFFDQNEVNTNVYSQFERNYMRKLLTRILNESNSAMLDVTIVQCLTYAKAYFTPEVYECIEFITTKHSMILPKGQDILLKVAMESLIQILKQFGLLTMRDPIVMTNTQRYLIVRLQKTLLSKSFTTTYNSIKAIENAYILNNETTKLKDIVTNSSNDNIEGRLFHSLQKHLFSIFYAGNLDKETHEILMVIVKSHILNLISFSCCIYIKIHQAIKVHPVLTPYLSEILNNSIAGTTLLNAVCSIMLINKKVKEDSILLNLFFTTKEQTDGGPLFALLQSMRQYCTFIEKCPELVIGQRNTVECINAYSFLLGTLMQLTIVRNQILTLNDTYLCLRSQDELELHEETYFIQYKELVNYCDYLRKVQCDKEFYVSIISRLPKCLPKCVLESVKLAAHLTDDKQDERNRWLDKIMNRSKLLESVDEITTSLLYHDSFKFKFIFIVRFEIITIMSCSNGYLTNWVRERQDSLNESQANEIVKRILDVFRHVMRQGVFSKGNFENNIMQCNDEFAILLTKNLLLWTVNNQTEKNELARISKKLMDEGVLHFSTGSLDRVRCFPRHMETFRAFSLYLFHFIRFQVKSVLEVITKVAIGDIDVDNILCSATASFLMGFFGLSVERLKNHNRKQVMENYSIFNVNDLHDIAFPFFQNLLKLLKKLSNDEERFANKSDLISVIIHSLSFNYNSEYLEEVVNFNVIGIFNDIADKFTQHPTEMSVLSKSYSNFIHLTCLCAMWNESVTPYLFNTLFDSLYRVFYVLTTIDRSQGKPFEDTEFMMNNMIGYLRYYVLHPAVKKLLCNERWVSVLLDNIILLSDARKPFDDSRIVANTLQLLSVLLLNYEYSAKFKAEIVRTLLDSLSIAMWVLPDLIQKRNFLSVLSGNDMDEVRTKLLFDPAKSMRQCSIVQGAIAIRYPGTSGYVVADMEMTSGCYVWKVGIAQEFMCNDSILVGVCKWPVMEYDNYKESKNVWLYQSSSGHLYNGGLSQKKFPRYVEGDTVTIKLDMDEKTISFDKNSGCMEIAFSNFEPSVILHPCIYFRNSSTQSMVKINDIIRRKRKGPWCFGEPQCAPEAITIAQCYVTLLRQLHSDNIWEKTVNDCMLTKLRKLRDVIPHYHYVKYISPQDQKDPKPISVLDNPKLQNLDSGQIECNGAMLDILTTEVWPALAVIVGVDSGLQTSHKCHNVKTGRNGILYGTVKHSLDIVNVLDNTSGEMRQCKWSELQASPMPTFNIDRFPILSGEILSLLAIVSGISRQMILKPMQFSWQEWDIIKSLINNNRNAQRKSLHHVVDELWDSAISSIRMNASSTIRKQSICTNRNKTTDDHLLRYVLKMERQFTTLYQVQTSALKTLQLLFTTDYIIEKMLHDPIADEEFESNCTEDREKYFIGSVHRILNCMFMSLLEKTGTNCVSDGYDPQIGQRLLNLLLITQRRFTYEYFSHIITGVEYDHIQDAILEELGSTLSTYSQSHIPLDHQYESTGLRNTDHSCGCFSIAEDTHAMDIIFKLFFSKRKMEENVKSKRDEFYPIDENICLICFEEKEKLVLHMISAHRGCGRSTTNGACGIITDDRKYFLCGKCNCSTTNKVLAENSRILFLLNEPDSQHNTFHNSNIPNIHHAGISDNLIKSLQHDPLGQNMVLAGRSINNDSGNRNTDFHKCMKECFELAWHINCPKSRMLYTHRTFSLIAFHTMRQTLVESFATLYREKCCNVSSFPGLDSLHNVLTLIYVIDSSLYKNQGNVNKEYKDMAINCFSYLNSAIERLIIADYNNLNIITSICSNMLMNAAMNGLCTNDINELPLVTVLLRILMDSVFLSRLSDKENIGKCLMMVIDGVSACVLSLRLDYSQRLWCLNYLVKVLNQKGSKNNDRHSLSCDLTGCTGNFIHCADVPVTNFGSAIHTCAHNLSLSLLAMCDENNIIGVYSTLDMSLNSKCKILNEQQSNVLISNLAWSISGKYLSALSCNKIYVWSSAGGVKKEPQEIIIENEIQQIEWIYDGCVDCILFLMNKEMYLLEYASNTKYSITLLRHTQFNINNLEYNITDSDYFNDGFHIFQAENKFVVSKNSQFAYERVPDKSNYRVFRLTGKPDDVKSMKYDSTGNCLAMCFCNHIICKLFRRQSLTNELYDSLDLMMDDEPVELAWSPFTGNKSVLSIGTKGGFIYIWLIDIDSATLSSELLYKLKGVDSKPVHSLQYHCSGMLLATSCGEAVNIWYLQEGIVIYGHKGTNPVKLLYWLKDGGLFISYHGESGTNVLQYDMRRLCYDRQLCICLSSLSKRRISLLQHLPLATYFQKVLKVLPLLLRSLYSYESSLVCSGKTLLYSDYLRALVDLTISLELYRVLSYRNNPPNATPEIVSNWRWLCDLTIAMETAEAIVKAAPLPKRFVEHHIPKEIAEESWMDNHLSKWDLHCDYELVDWFTKRPDDWKPDISQFVAYMCGNGGNGQISGSQSISNRLVEIESLQGVKQIVCGYNRTFAVYFDGRVVSFGEGSSGHLGHGDSLNLSNPRVISALRGFIITQVATSIGRRAHTLALTSCGEVFSWGYGGSGKLGHGTTEFLSSPKQIKYFLNNAIVKQVACGRKHSAVISYSGVLFTFGSGKLGQLGHGSMSEKSTPEPVKALREHKIDYVDCGFHHTVCYSEKSLMVWSFGEGTNGKLGYPGTIQLTPKAVEALEGVKIRKISCGQEITLFLSESGRVYSCGHNYSGLTSSAGPRVIQKLKGTYVKDISTGPDFSIALTANGHLYTWGNNENGQLASGTFEYRDKPLLVPTTSRATIRQVNAGNSHIACWTTPLIKDSKPISLKNQWLGLPNQMPVEFGNLQNYNVENVRSRLLVLRSFSDIINVVWNFIPLGISPQHRNSCQLHRYERYKWLCSERLRPVLLPTGNRLPLIKSITNTMTSTRSSRSEIVICRINSNEPIFYQMARQVLDLNPLQLRVPLRAWKIRLYGEGADDAGGVFDEMISCICSELSDGTLPFLIPTPNGANEVGYNRDRYILNPLLRSPQNLLHFKFLGIVFGIAIRTKRALGLPLSNVVWKLLTAESLSFADIQDNDCLYANAINDLINMTEPLDVHEYFENELPLGHLCGLSWSRQHVENPKALKLLPLAWDNRLEFIEEIVNFRLHEMDEQASAIREGMSLVVPVPVLSLFKSSIVEELTCGWQAIPIPKLKEIVKYSREEYETHQVVKWLWSILEEYSEEQKACFLRFVSGRSRLPVDVINDQNNYITITITSGQANLLPEALTCFMTLRLPNYTTREIMNEKLTYAVANCRSIDLDHYILADEYDAEQIL